MLVKLVRKFQGALTFYLSLNILLRMIFSISYIIPLDIFSLLVAWLAREALMLQLLNL